MNVRIKYCPANPDALAGWAAALCTNSSNPERSFDNAVASGHRSVLEHASFTFEISGVSRALLAQLTRHRIASYSVQSQRYVRQDKDECFPYVTPLKIRELGEYAINTFDHQMKTINGWYKEWRDVIRDAGGSQREANEDARFVLPMASATKLGMTMNMSELLHFFELRCCNCAQWEIRELAWRMLLLCREVAPKTFANAGPGCVRGCCPEKIGCGRPYAKVD
jgi:thymidylate synthase (FAD)